MKLGRNFEAFCLFRESLCGQAVNNLEMYIANAPAVSFGAAVVAAFQLFSFSSVAESDISNIVTAVGDTSIQRAVESRREIERSTDIERKRDHKEDERKWRRRQY
jgi:hypothetical protein